MNYEELYTLAAQVEERLQPVFRGFERTAEKNTKRVLDAFRTHRVSEPCFAGTTGYGYDDLGRETLEKVYADVFGAEAALVRTTFVNGTHAIACALYGALQPGDTILAGTGAPYETLHTAITGSGRGSLASLGIRDEQLELASDGGPDYAAITQRVSELRPAAAFVQRSRGYAPRRALSVAEIGEIVRAVKAGCPDTAVIVDNCYGEFTEECEPTALGADLIAGSLIKNPGGGLAPMGGYVAGRADLVEQAAERLTLPGIQKGSPVDSFALPVPAPMPGYESPVVMAAGTFIQGASLELSCDGPVREPYLGFLQGGLTFESGKLGVLSALSEMLA